jgi:hypothetical protein
MQRKERNRIRFSYHPRSSKESWQTSGWDNAGNILGLGLAQTEAQNY